MSEGIRSPKKKTLSLTASIVFLSALFYMPHYASAVQNDNPTPIKVVSSIDKKKVGIGDRLLYKINIYTPAGVEIEPPSLKEKIGVFDIVDSGTATKAVFTGSQIMQWYIIRCFETGEHIIPPITVRYRISAKGDWRETASNSRKIVVSSIFEKLKVTDNIRDIEPPTGFEWPYKYHILIGLAALFLLILVSYIYIKRQQAILEDIRRGPPPELVVYNRLSAMLSDASAAAKIDRLYFITVADLLREYLEYRLKLGTRGMTTKEFLNRLKEDKGMLDEGHKEKLTSLLETADLIKFASYNLDTEGLAVKIKTIKKILNDTRPREYV